MKKILVIDEEKCTGCRMCEVVCSWWHEQEFNPALARIQIVSDKSESFDWAVVCQQCEKAMCQETCPAGAIYFNAEFNAYVVDEKKCIGCKMCISSCPVGAMGFNPEKGVSIKCDLCEGDPKCVKYCPAGAIEFIESEKVSLKKKYNVLQKFVQELESAGGK